MIPLAAQPTVAGSDYVNTVALDAKLRALVAGVNNLVALANRVRQARLQVADDFAPASVRLRMLSANTITHLTEIVRLLASVQAQAAIVPALSTGRALGTVALADCFTAPTAPFVVLVRDVPNGRWTFTVPGDARSHYRYKLRVRGNVSGTYGRTLLGEASFDPDIDNSLDEVWRESTAYGTRLPPTGLPYDTTGGVRGIEATAPIYGYADCDHLWIELDGDDYRFFSLNWQLMTAENQADALDAIAPAPMDRIVDFVVRGGDVITIGYDAVGDERNVDLSTAMPADDDTRFPYQPGYRSAGDVQIDLLGIEPYLFPGTIDQEGLGQTPPIFGEEGRPFETIFGAAPALPVLLAPAITSPLTANGSAAIAFTYTITAANNPTVFTATGLPAGLSLNPVTGVISGTPTTVAVTPVVITADNGAGIASATLVLTVVESFIEGLTSVNGMVLLLHPSNGNLYVVSDGTNGAGPWKVRTMSPVLVQLALSGNLTSQTYMGGAAIPSDGRLYVSAAGVDISRCNADLTGASNVVVAGSNNIGGGFAATASGGIVGFADHAGAQANIRRYDTAAATFTTTVLGSACCALGVTAANRLYLLTVAGGGWAIRTLASADAIGATTLLYTHAGTVVTTAIVSGGDMARQMVVGSNGTIFFRMSHIAGKVFWYDPVGVTGGEITVGAARVSHMWAHANGNIYAGVGNVLYTISPTTRTVTATRTLADSSYGSAPSIWSIVGDATYLYLLDPANNAVRRITP